MLNKNLGKYRLPFLILLLFIIIVYIFGSNLPRFFYEGYLWLIYLVTKNLEQKSFVLKFFQN